MIDIGSIPNSSTNLIAAASNTPSVAGGVRFAIIVPITVTNFLGDNPEQIIIVLAVTNVTITNNQNIMLNGGVDFNMVSGDVLLLQQGSLPIQTGIWTELCRLQVGVITFSMNVYGLLIVYQPWDTTYPAVLAFPGGMFGEESGWVTGGVDFQRTYTGNANSLTAFLKRRKVLKWDYLTQAKITDLEAVWQFGGQFNFRDAVDPDNAFTGIMLAEPKFKQDFHGIWSGQVEVQQV